MGHMVLGVIIAALSIGNMFGAPAGWLAFGVDRGWELFSKYIRALWW